MMQPDKLRPMHAYHRLEESGVLEALVSKGSYRVDCHFRYSGSEGPKGGHASRAIKNDIHELERQTGMDFGLCPNNNPTIKIKNKQALDEASKQMKEKYQKE